MKKLPWIFVGITAAFCCILIGFFIGRNTTRTYIPVDSVVQSQTGIETEADTAADTEQSNDGRININTATEQQLMLLPGVGEVTAKKIIEYRTENGDFNTIEDIMQVSGIGEKKFEQMKSYIKVE